MKNLTSAFRSTIRHPADESAVIELLICSPFNSDTRSTTAEGTRGEVVPPTSAEQPTRAHPIDDMLDAT